MALSPSSSSDPLAGQQAATSSPHSPSIFHDSSIPVRDRSEELEVEPALPPGSLSRPRTKILQSIQRPVRPLPRSKKGQGPQPSQSGATDRGSYEASQVTQPKPAEVPMMNAEKSEGLQRGPARNPQR